MADRQGNTAIPVHRPCAVERWFELRWKDVGPASMQFQPQAVIVVFQEICQIAHDMELGIDWIAHGESASRKVSMFIVFPVCPLQCPTFPMESGRAVGRKRVDKNVRKS